MAIERRGLFAIALVVAALSSIRNAGAQVHWDVGIQAGATERLTNGPAPGPTPGPSAEVHAHVAVLPMLRIGPYAAFDLSPVPNTIPRQFYAAGLRAKLSPPWLSAPWHAWGFLGVGLADAYAPSHHVSDAVVPSSSIGMLELPVGVGCGRKLHGPWELYAELGAHIVLVRESLRSGSTGSAAPVLPLIGDDLLAVSLSVGVSLTR